MTEVSDTGMLLKTTMSPLCIICDVMNMHMCL